MLVKICGITRLEDAEAAVEAGAGAIGFVFWPQSPRFIDPYRARRIAARLPGFVTAVGVFVNQPVEYVKGVAALVRLGALQLHGDETMDYAAELERPVIKAVGIGDGGSGISTADDSGADVFRWPSSVTLLLDVHDPVRRGGSGRTIDWGRAAEVSARRRILLAGGLRSENVSEAVRRVRPFGIDVSSGVEASPGIKDHSRISKLFEALHEAGVEPARP
jgi:phosphoribosylanthranilate isomerase